MKHLFKFIVALGVFTMTIGSGFAMDNNPPTEPVKVTVETEVVEEVQPILNGYGYYNSITGKCEYHDNVAPIGCSTANLGPQCTINVGLSTFLMFEVSRATENDEWVCGDKLREPL